MIQSNAFNRSVYVFFVAVGLYFALIAKDYSQSSIYLGLALAFDPFDYKVKWQERPSYQKGILILHLAFVAGLFGYGLGR